MENVQRVRDYGASGSKWCISIKSPLGAQRILYMKVYATAPICVFCVYFFGSFSFVSLLLLFLDVYLFYNEREKVRIWIWVEGRKGKI